MKKIYLIIAALLFSFTSTIRAQVINEEEEPETEIEENEDETIEMPEGMTLSIDTLMHLYNAKTYLKQDPDCNMPNVNPVYDAEVYMDRLNRLPTIIEMPYNEVVQQFIDKYSGQLRQSVSIMLGAQNFYMPIFEQALETYGLPLELKYLPVIESALNPKAVSRVGATGLWQFMLATGKQYGLEVNSLVDERRDPIKSSYAAAHYLSDLYKIFGDWNLVIAAYNCGPENIGKAIHRAKGETDYWQIYPYLPRETRGYVPAFIAANYIMNYYCEHNICPMLTDLPAKSDTIIVNRNVHFDQIAHALNITSDQLRELNPQYRQNVVNGLTKPSALRLPAALLTQYIDNEDSICAYNADQLLSKRTVVDVNDEVPSYDRPSRKSYSKKSWKSSKKSGKRGSKRSKKSKKRSSSVTVKSGDTLSSIAKRNGTTVAKLKKLNKISGSTIRKGKKLRVK